MKINKPSREALIRYYRGQSTPNEEQLIELYLSMDIDHEYVEACMQEAWYKLKEDAFTVSEEQRYTAWGKFQHKKAGLKQLPASRSLKWYGYAASVAILLVSISAILYFQAATTKLETFAHYAAELGHPREISLIDSSKVTLFPGSSIDVPANFNQSDRRVELKGRAFFKVAHHKQKPFLVASGKLTTRVLGTSFEVNATDLDHTSSITLQTGRVAVASNGKDIASLMPNQRIVYHNQHQNFKIETVDAVLETSWLKGELSYELAPLSSIFSDMEKWYNVKIKVNDLHLLDKKITTSFKDLPIDKVLNMLSVTTGFTYTRKGKEILIKGNNK